MRKRYDESKGKLVITNDTSSSIKLLGAGVSGMQQYREVLVNAIESGATKGLFSLYETLNGLKLAFMDNGPGMSAYELELYIGGAFSSSKLTEHGFNAGIGIKIAGAKNNPFGITFISWSKENPEGAMVRFFLDADGQYKLEVVEVFDPETGETTYSTNLALATGGVKRPSPRDMKMPNGKSFLRDGETGTMVIFEGISEEDVTIQPPADAKDKGDNWIHRYINSRFASFGNFELFALRFGTSEKGARTYKVALDGGIKSRAIGIDQSYGLLYELDRVSLLKGSVELSNGTVHYYYFGESKNDRKQKGAKGDIDHKYVIKNKCVFLHKNELYAETDKLGLIRSFGLGPIAAHTVLVVEPKNVAYDLQRKQLERRGGEPIDFEDFNVEFRDNIPAKLKKVVDSARSEALTAKVDRTTIKEHFEDFRSLLPKTGSYKRTKTGGGALVPTGDTSGSAEVHASAKPRSPSNNEPGNSGTPRSERQPKTGPANAEPGPDPLGLGKNTRGVAVRESNVTFPEIKPVSEVDPNHADVKGFAAAYHHRGGDNGVDLLVVNKDHKVFQALKASIGEDYKDLSDEDLDQVTFERMSRCFIDSMAAAPDHTKMTPGEFSAAASGGLRWAIWNGGKHVGMTGLQSESKKVKVSKVKKSRVKK